MNNKKGGVGARILLVLILMIASAIGGAYGYRVLDGKLAVRDAQKSIDIVRVSDYDSPESTEVQNLIDSAKKDLETASTRKEVYGIIEDFNTDLAKIKTKTQKELEQALKEAEEARNSSKNNNSNNNYYNNDDYNSNSNSSNYGNSNDSSANSSSNSGDDSSVNSNNNSGNGSAITNDNGDSGRSGLLSNLLGGSDD